MRPKSNVPGILRWVAVGLLWIGFSGSAWSACGPGFWQQQEQACQGSLQQMLTALRQAPKIPQLRTSRSPDELFAVLKRIGRFQQLGLSDPEGRILVDAFYEHQAIRPGPPRVPDQQAAPRTESDGELTDYRAGTEFEPLDAVLMRWPTANFPWQTSWGQMISALENAGVTVYIWVNGRIALLTADLYLSLKQIPASHVAWVPVRTDSVWMRDYGPQFVYDQADSDWGIVDFHYYSERTRDDRTPAFIAQSLGVPLIDRQSEQVVYTEGGNLNHDGLGCVVYSRRTYENNPGVAEATIDQRILSAFQAHKAIVPQDPSLDGTGHVDMFLKIISSNTVLVGRYGSDQVDYQTLEDCAARFETASNGAGEPWNVVRIPQPDVYYQGFVWPVVRTYTNSLIANNTVIVPVYNIPEDDEAIAIYGEQLPGKTIVAIDATHIIESGGAWHCVTMEMPSPDNP